MARQVKILAFQTWIQDEANVNLCLEHIANGKTLVKLKDAVNQPYHCLHEFFHSEQMLPRYEAARKAWADHKQDEAMELADDVAPDRDAVAKAKLQIETRQNQAKAYHRERWGERLQVDRNVNVSADAELLGSMGELLKRVRGPKIVEGEVLPVGRIEVKDG